MYFICKDVSLFLSPVRVSVPRFWVTLSRKFWNFCFEAVKNVKVTQRFNRWKRDAQIRQNLWLETILLLRNKNRLIFEGSLKHFSDLREQSSKRFISCFNHEWDTFTYYQLWTIKCNHKNFQYFEINVSIYYYIFNRISIRCLMPRPNEYWT